MAVAVVNTKALEATAPVKTTGGAVTGVVRANDLAFLGIPYAKARRFAAPECANPWSGTRAANAIGFAAPQNVASRSGRRRQRSPGRGLPQPQRLHAGS